jgi:hypothetical protein
MTNVSANTGDAVLARIFKMPPKPFTRTSPATGNPKKTD